MKTLSEVLNHDAATRIWYLGEWWWCRRWESSLSRDGSPGRRHKVEFVNRLDHAREFEFHQDPPVERYEEGYRIMSTTKSEESSFWLVVGHKTQPGKLFVTEQFSYSKEEYAVDAARVAAKTTRDSVTTS